MRRLKKLKLPLLLALSPLLGAAPTAVVEWTHDYEREDGSPIAPGDLLFLVYQDGVLVGETHDLSLSVAHVRCAEYAVAVAPGVGNSHEPAIVVSPHAPPQVAELALPGVERRDDRTGRRGRRGRRAARRLGGRRDDRELAEMGNRRAKPPAKGFVLRAGRVGSWWSRGLLVTSTAS